MPSPCAKRPANFWRDLIIGVVYLAVAGVLFSLGRKQLRDLKPPERVMQTVKQDIKTAKSAFTSGMNSPISDAGVPNHWNRSLAGNGARSAI